MNAGPERARRLAVQPDAGAGGFERIQPRAEQRGDRAGQHVAGAGGRQPRDRRLAMPTRGRRGSDDRVGALGDDDRAASAARRRSARSILLRHRRRTARRIRRHAASGWSARRVRASRSGSRAGAARRRRSPAAGSLASALSSAARAFVRGQAPVRPAARRSARPSRASRFERSPDQGVRARLPRPLPESMAT